MQEKNGKMYIDLSDCAWTFGSGESSFNGVSRKGFQVVTTPDKILLTGAINKKYAERHPDEPQLITGFELHVPNEGTIYSKNFLKTPSGIVKGYGGRVINDAREIRQAMKEMNIGSAMTTPNNHKYAMYRAATTTDTREQKSAAARLEEAFLEAKKLGARTVVLWNGAEKYSNPFEVDMQQMINGYIRTLKTAAQYAIKYDMYVAVEPKPFEPGDEMFPNNSGFLMAIVYTALKSGALTKEEVARIGANDEMGHVEMANCDLRQNYEILKFQGKNFHAHLNRQFSRGKHDTDNELQMTLDAMAVVDTLRTDPVFMSKKVRRFAGFDYQWRHNYDGSEGLLSLYANGLRVRALEEISRQMQADKTIPELRANHRYVQLAARVSELLFNEAGPVENEIQEVGKEGIKVPKHLEKIVNMTILN